MEPTTYEIDAKRIADAMGLTVVAAFKGDRCPAWDTDKCRRGDHSHGDRYRVTLKRHGRTLSFDFWHSINDSADGRRPGYYDILATISSDAFSPTDPDEVVAEYGAMKPSQAIAVARFAARLQAFFTPDELTELAKIS